MKSKVVLVPFPFDDLSATKVRPAVCLTNPIGLHRHIILAFISSQIPHDKLDSDVMLATHPSDFPLTGLRVTSVLRLHRLLTVTTSFLRRELGEVAPDTWKQIESKLKKMFDLT